MKINTAEKSDAELLAELINLAGEGVPKYLWSGLAEDGETALDVGIRRASREEGGFSYRNARVVRIGEVMAGMIISYPLDDSYIEENIDRYPPVIQPLIELEQKVIGSWYINAVATPKKYRGQGYATLLMEEAEAKAKREGYDRMSLIVASENTTARNLYFNMGYKFVESRPITPFPDQIFGGEWELMVKKL